MKIKFFAILFTLIYIGISNSALAFAIFNKSQENKLKSDINTDPKKRILILNAYHEGFHWTDRTMEGIKSVVNQDENTELFINYMDTKRCSDSIYFQQLKNTLAHKYKHINFNAIISTDDHALDFLLSFRDSIFPNVPVVFCGINDYKPSRIENHNLFTGVYESYDLEGTVKLIMNLHPKTKEIAVISDGTLSGNAFNNRFKRLERDFEGLTKFRFLTNLYPQEIKQELQSLSESTAIIWSIYIRKPDGGVLSSQESIKLITSSTEQPVYCVWDVVGQGVVGGKITDPIYQGKRSAEIAKELLSGKSIAEIPVEGSPLVYKFDFNILEKFAIPESKLPKNNIIINSPFSFYQAHRNKILAVSFLIILLTIVVIVLIYLVQKQKQAKSEVFIKNLHLEEAGLSLRESNNKLTKALEIAQKSKELEEANKLLMENEKIQKKLNEDLKISNLTKDKFFGIIAHDLRSPLNTIYSIASLLNKNFEDLGTEQQKEFLRSLDSTVKSTHKLLDNLLLWSQSQTGNIEFKPEKLDLNLLIKETQRLFTQALKNKSIIFSNRVIENTFVLADREMLLSVIRNLISNAIKFTPKGGKIYIEANKTIHIENIEFAEISVVDSGVGIPEKIKGKLFNIGENTSTKGTNEESGTGLGLLLCNEFVERHKGSIRVKSEINQGSKFIFTIPVYNN